MISAIIIDDEQDSIESICRLISLNNIDVEIIASANNIQDGQKLIARHNPQVILLDIQIGNELGFSLLTHFDPFSFQVIFISAYDKYAVQAFKFSAIDYLLKPIDASELEHAIERVKMKIVEKVNPFPQLASLLRNLQSTEPFLLAVPTSDGLDFININEIISIRAEGSYSVISTCGAKTMLISKNIGEFQEQLPRNTFCRVHNSFLVNMKHVKKLRRKGGLAAEMTEGENIPISRNKKESFMNQIEHFVYS